MELRIEQKNLPEPLKFNYDELKTQIEQVANDYAVSVYTEDMIKSAKSDKAKLNALKKSLNDERLRREREWMEPFQDFKAKINEIISIIDKPVQIIDLQVKEYEERVKTEKRKEIARWVEDNREELKLPHWIVLHKIFNEKWLNATCSAKTWQGDLMTFAEKLNGDIATIEALPEYSFEAMEAYKESLDLGQAMREGKRLHDIQKAKEAEQRVKEIKEQEQKILADKIRGAGKSPSEAEIEAFSAKVESDKAALEKGKEEGVKRWWVDIRACVTMNQANDLKAYFAENEIEYTATTER